jgi:hypothetical protein
MSTGSASVSRAGRADKRGREQSRLSDGNHGEVRVGLGDISYDKEHLPGAHQAEIAPGDFVDGRTVFAKVPNILAHLRVPGPEALEFGGQLAVLLAGPPGGHQALIAHQRVDHERADDEEQRRRQEAAPEVAHGTRKRRRRIRLRHDDQGAWSTPADTMTAATYTVSARPRPGNSRPGETHTRLARTHL